MIGFQTLNEKQINNMEIPILEAKINLLLTPEQAHLLLMTITSGLINMDAWQKTMSMVLGDTTGEKNTAQIIKHMNEIGVKLNEEIKKFNNHKTSPLTKV